VLALRVLPRTEIGGALYARWFEDGFVGGAIAWAGLQLLAGVALTFLGVVAALVAGLRREAPAWLPWTALAAVVLAYVLAGRTLGAP
jgi:hypothetical protein